MASAAKTLRGERIGVSRGFRAANGVARNFRKQHGEVAFATLASEVFREADEDHSGKIDAKEVEKVLKKLGLILSENEVAEVMRRYDVGNADNAGEAGNGTLDEKEWLELVSDLIDGTFDTKAQEAVEAAARGLAQDAQPNFATVTDVPPPETPARSTASTSANNQLVTLEADSTTTSVATTPRAQILSVPNTPSAVASASVTSGEGASRATPTPVDELAKLRAENKVLASRVFDLEAANAVLEARLQTLEQHVMGEAASPRPG